MNPNKSRVDWVSQHPFESTVNRCGFGFSVGTTDLLSASTCLGENKGTRKTKQIKKQRGWDTV